ncbi:MAG TPA: hypothetical protein VFO07_12215, partial [Roseiflexaceae bacterium]|nr:hypothetical protein [Roseiflexaceae bacterium]
MTSRTIQREGVARELKPADRAGIRSAIDVYTTSWLTNDPEAVMRTLTQDAVLIPHHGVPPVEGAAAIRTFWWPEGGSPTTI